MNNHSALPPLLHLNNSWLSHGSISGPTPGSISSYHSWVAAGCPNETILQPYIPHFALESAYAANVMGLLCWDDEIRSFMDARKASSFLPAGSSVHSSLLQDMINNFENQLIQHMADLLLERKRLIKQISLLVEASAVAQSIINMCYSI